MKKNYAGVFIIGLSLVCLIICARSIALEYEEYDTVSETLIDGERHERITQEMIMMLDEDPELKAMMEESIAIASVYNPDQNTNPVQSLETYYDFLDWSATCMPWSIYDAEKTSLYRSAIPSVP